MQGFLPFNAQAPTLQRIYSTWLNGATLAVQTYAKYLLRGRLLRPDTWTLHNSIYRTVAADGKYGEVGSNAPHAILWEIKGIQGPIEPQGGAKFIAIRKRGTSSARSRLKIVQRARTYTKTTYKRPVAFLRTALMHEMTGSKGRKRYQELGLAVGIAVLIRYLRLIHKDYGVVSVSANSAGLAVRMANISNEYGFGVSVSGPATKSTIMSGAMRKAGVLTR